MSKNTLGAVRVRRNGLRFAPPSRRSRFMAVCLACYAFAAAKASGGENRVELPPDQVRRIDQRYVPFADWRDSPLPAELSQAEASDAGERYWRTAEAIRNARRPNAAPLEGLKVALDPGHVGGAWAEADQRSFRLQGKPPVREGDLALEVAQAARERLRSLGANVVLTRERRSPVAEFEADERARLTGKKPNADPREAAAKLDYAARELRARARRVNETLRPDLLISLHFDAAPWPDPDTPSLVSTNRSHALVFGAVMENELARPEQRQWLRRKLLNGSGPEEDALARAVGENLAETFGLPPMLYAGRNAIALPGADGYAWARNLLILRQTRCPTVMIEPFMANSERGFAAIQDTWPETKRRYVDVVATALLDTYGPQAGEGEDGD